MQLLKTVSRRTWHKVGVLIVVGLMFLLTVATVVAVIHDRSTANTSDPDSSSILPPDGTDEATTPQSSTTPTPAIPPEASVVGFEKAYYMGDAVKRKAALRPYVTDSFYKTLSTAQGMAVEAGSDVEVSLDVNYTADPDGDVAYISSIITVQTSRNGQAITAPFTLPVHHTTWVLSESGTWLADSETVLKK